MQGFQTCESGAQHVKFGSAGARVSRLSSKQVFAIKLSVIVQQQITNMQAQMQHQAQEARTPSQKAKKVLQRGRTNIYTWARAQDRGELEHSRRGLDQAVWNVAKWAKEDVGQADRIVSNEHAGETPRCANASRGFYALHGLKLQCSQGTQP